MSLCLPQRKPEFAGALMWVAMYAIKGPAAGSGPSPCAGEHGGQGQKLSEEGSFLLDSNSMFRWGSSLLNASLVWQLNVYEYTPLHTPCVFLTAADCRSSPLPGRLWSCCLPACRRLPLCVSTLDCPIPNRFLLPTSRPLMELLFARLPPPLRAAAVRRVAKFLLESTLTSVGAEASVLCNAVAWSDPQVGAGGGGLTAGLTVFVGAGRDKLACCW